MKADGFDGVALIFSEKVIAQLIHRIELRAIDRIQNFHRRLQLSLAAMNRVQRHIAPAVILAGVTDLGGELRAFVHPIFPIQIKKLMQPFGVGTRLAGDLRATLLVRSLSR